MPITFFSNAYFLQSLGWGIANSFWQTAILWLLYQAITGIDKRLPAVIKYHLSLALLALSFIWFFVTLVTNYKILLNNAPANAITIWLFQFQQQAKILSCLAIIYFVLLTYYTIQFILHYFKNRFVRIHGLSKPPLDIRLYVTNTAFHLGIKKKVSVWLSKHIEVPSVTGFLNPIILLPFSIINNLSTEQVNAILVHELAHIKRNDYLLNFIQCFLELILFFNPFAIFLSNSAKKERENCCDDWVLTYRFNTLEYAKALLVLEEQRQHLPLTLAATSNNKLLLQRIKRFVNTSTPETNTNFLHRCKLLGVNIFILCGIYFVVPSYDYNNSRNKHMIEDISNILPIQSNKVLQKKHLKQDIPSPIIVEKGVAKLASKKVIARPTLLSKKSTSIKIDKNEYLLALINEDELFNKKQSPEVLPSAIVNQKKDSLQSVFVKVEEVQSGKEQTNIYYFNLKDDNGKIEIKPLLILKKMKVEYKKIGTKKLNFTKHIVGKKRIST